MTIRVIEGVVSSLREDSKQGRIAVVNGEEAFVPERLADCLVAGDEVRLAGEDRDGHLRVLALRNRSQGRSCAEDVVSALLLFGVGGFLIVFFGVLAIRGYGYEKPFMEVIYNTLVLSGLVICTLTLRRFWRINRASEFANLP